MPSRCRTAAWRQGTTISSERVFASAQSMIPAKVCQNGSSGRLAAFGFGAGYDQSVDLQVMRSAISAYCRSTRDFAGCDRLTDGSEKAVQKNTIVCQRPPSSRRMNWRSVACSAESGMLLMRPMVRTRIRRVLRAIELIGFARLPGRQSGADGQRMFLEEDAHPGPVGLFRGLKAR